MFFSKSEFMIRLIRFIGGCLVCLASISIVLAADPDETSVPLLHAREIKGFAAPAGMQGVAVDDQHFYVVLDSVIRKRDKGSGRVLQTWDGSEDSGARHLNSCKIYGDELTCANSNFPQVPMASSIETFDKHSMEHIASHSLGVLVGSLTWLDRRDAGFWWAAFAHYGTGGGTPGKDTSWTSLVKFDAEWRRLAGWIFPDDVLKRMAPFSTSGGAWGPDNLLYVMGHDLPEMYVLRLPTSGSVLEHVATITIAAEGQAFAWDKSTDKRVVYAISRASQRVKVFEIPEIPGLQ